MATFTAQLAKTIEPALDGDHLSGLPIYFSHVLTANSATDDIFNLCKIPAGGTVVDFRIQVPDMDTNATPTYTLHVGDTVDPDRFVAASAAGQYGGVISPSGSFSLVSTTPTLVTAPLTAAKGSGGEPFTGTATGLPYTYAAEDTFRLTRAAGPATAAGTGLLIKGYIIITKRQHSVTP